MTVVRTSAGLVLIDTSNYAARDRTFALVRSVSDAPVFAAIYTHGHVDHASGCRRSSPRRRARAGRGRASSGTRRCRPLCPLSADRRLQRDRQRAPVRHPATLADGHRSCRSTSTTRRCARRRRRRARAPPRARRDRRPHLGVVPARARALHGRSVHLVRAERRQPAEGPALRGDWAVALRAHARARRRAADARPRPADRGRGARRAGARATPRLAGGARARDRRPDEPGRHARLDRGRGAAARRTSRSDRICGRSTTSPSSSCATSWRHLGGWWDGVPRTSSPRRAPRLARARSRALAGGVRVWSRAPASCAEAWRPRAGQPPDGLGGGGGARQPRRPRAARRDLHRAGGGQRRAHDAEESSPPPRRTPPRASAHRQASVRSPIRSSNLRDQMKRCGGEFVNGERPCVRPPRRRRPPCSTLRCGRRGRTARG